MQQNISYNLSSSSGGDKREKSFTPVQNFKKSKYDRDSDPIIVSAQSNTTDKTFLNNMDNSQSLVEFFNAHFKQDWFRTKYDPAYRTDLYLEKLRSLRARLPSYLSSYLPSDSDSQIFSPSPQSPQAEEISSAGAGANNSASSEKAETRAEEVESDKSPSIFASLRSAAAILPNYVCIPSLPLSISRPLLAAHLSTAAGFEELIVSEPLESFSMRRIAYVIYGSPYQAARAIALLDKSVVEGFVLHLVSNNNNSSKFKQVGKEFHPPIRLKYDLLNSARALYLLSCVYADIDFADVSTLINNFFNSNSNSNNNGSYVGVEESLMFMVDALRELHLFCYYCGKLFISKDELFSRCGRTHLLTLPSYSNNNRSRMGRGEEMVKVILDGERLVNMTFNDMSLFVNEVENSAEREVEEGELMGERAREKVLETPLDKKFVTHFVLNNPAPSNSVSGENNSGDGSMGREEAIKGELEKAVNKLGLAKYGDRVRKRWVEAKLDVIVETGGEDKCGICGKMFSGKKFVRKHVAGKHGDDVRGMIMDCYFKEYFLNYYRDEYKPTWEKFRMAKRKRK